MATSSIMSSCSVGLEVNEECHKIECKTKRGILLPLTDLSKEDRDLIVWRAGLNLSDIRAQTICYHHEITYGKQYESRQRQCCDPLSIHKKRVTSKLSSHLL